MKLFESVDAGCDALLESARNLAESARTMRHTTAIMRENAARMDAVKKRLREVLETNRKIAERMDEVIRSCQEARETMNRSVAALHRVNVEADGQRAEQPLTSPRSAIGIRQLADAELIQEPGVPLDLRTWKPEGDPH